MGLLDFFWKRGGTDPEAGTTTHETGEIERNEGASVVDAPPGLHAEGSPTGASDPGSITGDDAAGDADAR